MDDLHEQAAEVLPGFFLSIDSASTHSDASTVISPRTLTLVFTLIKGIGLREISAGVLHELSLGILAAKAIPLALYGRIDGAIRVYVFVIGETPRTEIVELAGRGISACSQPKQDCAYKRGRRVKARHNISPYQEISPEIKKYPGESIAACGQLRSLDLDCRNRRAHLLRA
jgi:hypothetical protein